MHHVSSRFGRELRQFHGSLFFDDEVDDMMVDINLLQNQYLVLTLYKRVDLQ